jgi:hypothetical protein
VRKSIEKKTLDILLIFLQESQRERQVGLERETFAHIADILESRCVCIPLTIRGFHNVLCGFCKSSEKLRTQLKSLVCSFLRERGKLFSFSAFPQFSDARLSTSCHTKSDPPFLIPHLTM